MSSYNRTFQLTIEDVDLIEEDMRKGEELLGRLHDQKIFYRPKKEVYVSG